jgi:hypothetical protein
MKAYKGFDKNLQCRGLQYEIGGTQEVDKVKLCNQGLHACEAPLDVFSYYAPGEGSRYCEVEMEGVSDERGGDSKRVAKKLTVGAEIGIPGLVKAHVEYVKAHTTMEHTDQKAATAGDRGAATAGTYGAATAGTYGAATAGDRGAATAGYRGAATAGDSGAAAAGTYGAATAGTYGAATAKGTVSVGKNGCGLVRGNDVKIKGGLGAVLVICEENADNWDIKEWKAFVVDGTDIRADTWYKLVKGKLVEAE